jgi:hypothetical protein
VLREAWPGLGEVVNSQELESDNEGSAAPSALVEEDVEKLLAQLMPAIKVCKMMCFIGLVERMPAYHSICLLTEMPRPIYSRIRARFDYSSNIISLF